MLLRLFSDIHLDFDAETKPKRNQQPLTDFLWFPESLSTDKDTVLVLAGDLWFDNRPFERRNDPKAWIELVAERFKAVVIVLGNHDYWDSSLQRAPQKAKESIASLSLLNVYLLERDALVLDDVKLVGATLWTDLGKSDPILMFNVPKMIKDYDFITYGIGNARRRLRVYDIQKAHQDSLSWIKTNAVRDYPGQKLIVLTHMAPSFRSIPDYKKTYEYSGYNPLYYSDLDYTVMELCPDYWMHGHIHNNSDYMVGATRVLCNPRGYATYDTDYDEWMLIDTSTAQIMHKPIEKIPVFTSSS